MAHFFFVLAILVFWLGSVYATSPYEASHAYFASRTLDTQSIALILAGIVVLTLFAVYLAVSLLHDKQKNRQNG